MATNNSINSVVIGQAQKGAFGELLTVSPNPFVSFKFPYSVNSRIVDTAEVGTGTVSSEPPFAFIYSGNTASSSATLTSKDRVQYQPGQGVSCFFTAIFTTGISDTTQIIGIGNDNDGFFFGYNGTSFGILHRNNGSDEWIYQASWDKDTVDGSAGTAFTLDPTKGNVFKIQFQWLGFGAINFFIEDPNIGEFIMVHQIQYANKNTAPSLSNPSLSLYAQAKNINSASPVTLKNSSFSAFNEGRISSLFIRNAIASSKSIGGTNTNILTIRNDETFQSLDNQSQVIVDNISIYNEGSLTNTDSRYSIYLNPTVGGTPSFTNINSDTSVVSYDTAGTTITGGFLLLNLFIGGNDYSSVNLKDYDIRLSPGDILVVAAESLGATTTLHASLSWKEIV